MKTSIWPEGARVAVVLSLLLETWSEGKAPTYFPRTTPLKPGATDLSAVRWSEYGPKEGIWRLADIVGEMGVSATVFSNALSAERYPEAIEHVARAGLDVAGHGYAQEQYLLDYSQEQQRALIRRCLDTLEARAGSRPRGWVTPIYGGDNHTAGSLAAEGLMWHCDALDASYPAMQQTTAGPIVAIPWCDFVDNRVRGSTPRAFFEVYRDTLNYLRAREPGSLLHLAVHAHFGGRPSMAAVFREILDYFSQCKDVWFATHQQVAECVVSGTAGLKHGYRQSVG